MKLTVIDNYDSFVYNIVRYLKELGCEVHIMRNDLIDYEIIQLCDGIVLSPGPGIPEEAGELLKVIQDFYLSKPILGICLGHQALGSFFGAHLKQAEEIIHGRTSLMRVINSDPIFDGLESILQVGRYHSWILENELSDVLIKTGEGPNDEVLSFRHQSLPIVGLQFHPESILTPEGRKMISNWLDFYVRSKKLTPNYLTHEIHIN